MSQGIQSSTNNLDSAQLFGLMPLLSLPASRPTLHLPIDAEYADLELMEWVCVWVLQDLPVFSGIPKQSQHEGERMDPDAERVQEVLWQTGPGLVISFTPCTGSLSVRQSCLHCMACPQVVNAQ